jgi:hypothetical protein
MCNHRRQIDDAGRLINRRGLHGGDLMMAVPISDFSGLVRPICALANAVASAAIEGLDRCMARFLGCEIKTDGAGFGALRPNTMAGCLLGIFGHQALQLGFSLLMFEVCLVRFV